MIKIEVIKTTQLEKIYTGKSKVHALNRINLTIKKGEIYKLLGPNGAGKTTFLRIIATQLMPSRGTAYIFGYDVIRDADRIREHIAVVPQDIATYGNFTPWEYVYYFSRLRGLSKEKTKYNGELALKAVQLWDLKDRTCDSLSGGEKKRAIIACALASDANILMLDEPTSGLDAIARRAVWSALRELVNQGKTILLTTHIMEEADFISDRLAIINHGQVIVNGTVEEIKSIIPERFRVVVQGTAKDASQLNNGNRTTKFGDKQIIYVKDYNEALELVGTALKNALKAEVSPITLEDVFVKIVGEVFPDEKNH